MNDDAIWTGRFQPPTNAHMATAQEILRRWQRLTIVVAYDVPPPESMQLEWSEYIRQSGTTSYAPGKNIFLPGEVVEMWEAGIKAAGLKERIRVSARGRPEFDVMFRETYHPDSYDFIVVRLPESETQIDVLHRTLLPRLHRRHVFEVVAPFVLHNTEIRSRVLNGGCSWAEHLPPGVIEVFRRLHGDARIRDAQ